MRLLETSESGPENDLAILRAVQEGAFVQGVHHFGGEFRKWALLGDPIEVWIAILTLAVLCRGERKRSGNRALHALDQVRDSSKEKLMIVGVAVRSLGGDTLESPSIGLANE